MPSTVVSSLGVGSNVTLSVVGHGITMSNQKQTSIGTVDRRVFAAIQATF